MAYESETEVGETRLYRANIPKKYPLTRVKRFQKKGTATNANDAFPITQAMVADHVLVGARDHADAKRLEIIANKHQCELRRDLFAPNLFLISFQEPSLERLHHALDTFNRETADIAYAEPDYVVHASLIPNDTRYSVQADKRIIKAPETWDITTGGSNVVIGIIDSGVEYTHPDLAPNLWTNPREIPGNGLDDDGNALIDDVHGWDFSEDDNTPTDSNIHGTHVAGIAAARGDNNLGIAGVSWNARIMPLKFIGADGSGPTSDAINCVYYAAIMRNAGHPIRLTNNSWGGSGASTALSNAITYHQDAGMLFVTAAGNGGEDYIGDDNDIIADYPGGYNHPSIINVANTTSSDNRESSSNFGATTVDLAAPGTGIYSTIGANSFNYLTGTSMAAPNVAGAAALLFSYAPDATSSDIKGLLMDGVDPIPAMDGITVTGGRLNVFESLKLLGLVVTESTPASASTLSNPPTVFDITFNDPIDPASLSAADFAVNGRLPANASMTGANSVRFTFATTPVITQGAQTMILSSGAVTRSSDGTPLRAWEATFQYDLLPLRVTSPAPSLFGTTGSPIVLELPLNHIDLTWSEALDPASVQADDLILNRGLSTGVQLPFANQTRFTTSGLTTEGTLELNILANTTTDAFGNGNLPHTVTLELDYTELPAADFVPRPRAGSLVYSRATTARHHTDDIDDIAISLRAGQTYTARVTPQADFTPTVTLITAQGAPLATGNPLPLTPITATGTYRLRISGTGVGDYDVLEILNAGFATDTTTIQSLPSALPLPGGSTRHAVVGSLTSATSTHRFSFNGPAGVALGTEPGSTVSLTVQRGGGTIDAQTGTESTIQVASPGAYQAVVTGSGDYTLHLTPDNHTDATDNETPASAQPLTRPAVLGGFAPQVTPLTAESEPNDDGVIGGSPADFEFANDATTAFLPSGGNTYTATITGDISTGYNGDWDFYRFRAAPGDDLLVEQLGAASGNGTLVDPWFRLFDRNGVMIANNDDIQSGIQRESRLKYVAFAYDGDYYMCAGSWERETGTYTLNAQLTTSGLQQSVRRDVFQIDLPSCETLDAELLYPNLGPSPNPLQVTFTATDATGAPIALPHVSTAAPGSTETIYLDLTPTGPAGGPYLLSTDIQPSCHALTITSPNGHLPLPFHGTQTRPIGSTITSSVVSPIFDNDTQIVCTGWSGTGSVPASGSTTFVTFTLDQPSTVTWNWATNHILRVSAGPGGTTSHPPTTLVPQGQVVTLSATPSDHWEFAGWTGAFSDTTPALTFVMDRAYTLTATFDRVLSPLDVAEVLPATSANLFGVCFLVPIDGAPTAQGYETFDWTFHPFASDDLQTWTQGLQQMPNPGDLPSPPPGYQYVTFCDEDPNLSRAYFRVDRTER